MLKPIAWNQVSFEVPQTWEISEIGTTYLQFENESGPAMEIKWNRIKGTFSPQKQLKRIASKLRRQKIDSLNRCPLPAHWEHQLSGFKSICFSWSSAETRSFGIILYCNVCHKASIIQFYGDTDPHKEPVWSQMILSYRDHPQTDNIEWAVFDVKLTIPQQYQIETYQFLAGAFKLAFIRKPPRQKIAFYRYSPAAVLLKNKPLIEFAGEKFSLPHSEPLAEKVGKYKVHKWIPRKHKSMWLNSLSRLWDRSSNSTITLWHLADKNRIHAIRISGHNIDQDFVNQLCMQYETI